MKEQIVYTIFRIRRKLMGAVVDVSIILILLMGAVVGFKRGIFKSAVMFIGAIVVIVLAYSLKNPVANLLYSFMPFFNFAGDFEGLTTLNLIIYEAIAFVIVYLLLMVLLRILIKVTGVFEKLLNFTIILGIQSKLLGALFGLVETFLFIFVALFLLNQIPATNSIVTSSSSASHILTASPILSNITKSYYEAFEEVISIKDQNMNDKEEYNRRCLEILIKYDIVDKNSVKELIANGKLNVSNAEEILEG